MLLHRFLLQPEDGMSVDHIDGNGLNNQRSNLRLATHGQNMMNRRKHVNNTSGYTGVCWDKGAEKWRATLSYRGKTLHIGRFQEPADAALARDKLARELHGEFAQLNFPET